MCGIIGGISTKNVVPVILDGLSKLEYRGYDSVGIAILNQEQKLQRFRTINRVESLQMDILDSVNANIGIGHTRWATHGGVLVQNAHPHFSHSKIAVVHNGIIENYAVLKSSLQKKGYIFESDTDTEVIAHLIYDFHQNGRELLHSVHDAIKLLHGSYAIGVISTDEPKTMVCVSNGAPLLLGVGIGEFYFSSDVSALLNITNKIIYFEDKDILKLNANNYTFYNNNLDVVKRDVVISNVSMMNFNLGNFSHYMQKEIFEQPIAIANTLQYLEDNFTLSFLDNKLFKLLPTIKRVQIIACGTSYNSGTVAKYWFENICNIPCQVDIASEYRYRNIQVLDDDLIISISQSGETADTLACIKHLRDEFGAKNLVSICNVAESSLVRISNFALLTRAGVEIGVASTKAFTTQLLMLLYLCYITANVKCLVKEDKLRQIFDAFRFIPHYIHQVLGLEDMIKSIAYELKDKDKAIFIGRNTMYPIGCEGALKIKELAYMHAESYPAGELKHGPLALIDKTLPVFVLMPQSSLYDKVKSNVEEILARDGMVYLITDIKHDDIFDKCHKVIKMPPLNLDDELIYYINPILYTIPLQLLAYHTAMIKGNDVDKPRNLAKSVTVE